MYNGLRAGVTIGCSAIFLVACCWALLRQALANERVEMDWFLCNGCGEQAHRQFR
jgi:hypothetical protein